METSQDAVVLLCFGFFFCGFAFLHLSHMHKPLSPTQWDSEQVEVPLFQPLTSSSVLHFNSSPPFSPFYFVSLFTLCFSMVFRSLALFQKSHYRGGNCVEYVIMEMFLMCWRKPQSLKRGWYVWLYSHEMKAHVR